MKAPKLREMTVEKLDEKLANDRQELFNLRFQHATAQLENTQRMKMVKRDIARTLTIKRELESGGRA